MTTPLTESYVRQYDGLHWDDASASNNLPLGIRIAQLSGLAEIGLRSVLVRFSEGYVEPRHTHGIEHATFLMEGRWIVEDKEVHPGAYLFGPSVLPHGPMVSPEGTMVFGCDLGTDFWHAHPPTPEQEAAAVPTVILNPEDVEWESAAGRLNLGDGVDVKVYKTDSKTGRLDMLVRLPAGYVDAADTAIEDVFQNWVVLEGSIHCGTEELAHGAHYYIPPGVRRDPLSCAAGAVVCVSSLSDPRLG